MRRHVVLLGAGASRAAFPNGDGAGYRIPVMDDLVDIIELQSLVDESGLEMGRGRNFEVFYGHLLLDAKYANIAEEIERRINTYFSRLSLVEHATIYDRLLVSLRSTDAVFTFNWDPFLFYAYQRNREMVPLPKIFFLHGNVRIAEIPGTVYLISYQPRPFGLSHPADQYTVPGIVGPSGRDSCSHPVASMPGFGARAGCFPSPHP